jgi:hypothetical protein
MAARRTVRGDVWTDKGTVWTVDVDLGRVVRQLWARYDVRDLLRNVDQLARALPRPAREIFRSAQFFP